MAIDEKALDAMVSGRQTLPSLRFFEWNEPVVTYGYLLDPALVRAWAVENGNPPIVQRPTGGGTVLHRPGDLSVSVLWPRRSGTLPDTPRACYAEIHSLLRQGIRNYLGQGLPELFSKANGACGAPGEPKPRFSVCFDEPVCDDVMLGGRKIIGGALRITRQAILYQGAVQLGRAVHMEKLKGALLAAFTERFGA